MSQKVEKYRKMISSAKNRLISKAKKSGIYENFGRDEVRKISAKKDAEVMSGKISWQDGNEIMREIMNFADWCANFDYQYISA